MEHKSDEYQKRTRRTSNIKRRATQSQRTIRTQVAAIASVFRRGPKKVIKKEAEIKEVVLKQSDPIRQAEFFLGRLPREEVDLLLSENGQYAVRVSGAKEANQSGLCLSVRWNNTNLHIIIMINEKGKYSVNRRKTFEYIDHLVKYYVTEKQTVCQQLGALLIKPVCRPDWIINGNKLTQEKKLGEGNFGEVWSGTLQRGDHVSKVAIKFLKQNKVPSSEELLFYKECRRLRALNHRHVVKFLGVTACEDSLKLIMELCDDGLCNYLRSNIGKLTLTVKGRILMHIARGMEYLANEGIIHRDLAARNCLIKNDIHKISDLGMAREGNLYKMSNRLKPVPIKWTAPDALRTGSYSQAADVWSYGVLIWEVMTDGQAPYADLQEKYGRRFTVRLLELLDEGYRLTLPSNTPSEISAIMANCMEKDAEKRKTFKEIREALEGFHVQRGGIISWSADTTSNKSASSQQTCKATLAVTKK
ncbi:hypothetical protein M514_01339 [Trichuris suis]|uniref:Tyrosine-protein kinase n=1 Tax=Trichuris suis TaxID=68888 RepID=A0A085MKC3_9BILA|nr:hypothetical protein M513_01339 [Trichuris suis]KFD72247.1 hypothetical protein M514_01339 [Trichuris suis]